ncbi:quinol monooxygenase YgiN [Arthrobacter stackebrandtii]|uniref:Quinol monooxygenase YgiN n=1 Tax=Arthrobacter stackebrandtii TaxID=272161 RepID=A0ABS4Z0W8_9MICC|nr:antibiotic biosynthesis monooxygenase [Arthrobacter stackebrandtii]MBP2414670.1 quinol monooxygenase YgiN [Arthrobacter stackebrandtii]PYH01763.1 antibiotic biosynthesis monooxygenase [Arthrobacter stackebrandtii]
MENTVLTGLLICDGGEQLAAVVAHLPLHLELTRAEPGCLSFDVVQTADPLVWEVSERFVDAAAFGLHQQRVRASEWGRETQGIRRDYSLSVDRPGA